MDRREAIKKLAFGGATVVGATTVMSTAAFAYGEPYNVTVTHTLVAGAGINGYEAMKVGVTFKVTAKCRASSPNTNDDATLEYPKADGTAGTANRYNLTVAAGGNNTAPAGYALYFNYLSPTNPNWGNGALPRNFTTVGGAQINYSPTSGINYLVRKTKNPSSFALGDYTPFNNNERISLTYEFRLRCSTKKYTNYRYSGYIQYNSAGVSWSNANMALTTFTTP